MKKNLKFMFDNLFPIIAIVFCIYFVVKNKPTEAVFCFLFATLFSIETAITDVKEKCDSIFYAISTSAYIVEKGANGVYDYRKRKIISLRDTANYGSFILREQALRHAHLLNTGRWDKRIGISVCVANNCGCYVDYQEFFDINDCEKYRNQLSSDDIITGKTYEVLDIGHDTKGNKLLVLYGSFNNKIYLYRYDDLENYVTDSRNTLNIYEVL